MLITLLTQVLVPLLLMIGGLIGLSRAKRKGALLVVGGMFLVAFGIALPAIVIYSHVNRPKWCQTAFEIDPRAQHRPHDAFINACQKGSYEAIHCFLPEYAGEHQQRCANRSDEIAAILSAQ